MRRNSEKKQCKNKAMVAQTNEFRKRKELMTIMTSGRKSRRKKKDYERQDILMVEQGVAPKHAENGKEMGRKVTSFDGEVITFNHTSIK